MKTMAMVVRQDAYDLVLTPLAFAYLGAADYDEVNILFVNWAVRLLSKQGVEAVKPSADHTGTPVDMIEERVKAAGLPADLHEIFKKLKETGKVHLYACSLAAQIFGVEEKDLISEADGIVGATWFLMEKAEPATIFMQY
ncbi:peroxiredoxin family protein [Hydrogenivirga caldilitoris]|uniref:Peroxiredoxin family protein n=1 Tax=Hydrogenivirga caldilitoris TaxID=246264 RepID=A0A497XUA8_9AQUI|nr:DsrE/DsrF/DrsH-like family protein [Hydrogenivirga caldilitoris]RLJ71609.1 peroxiredoxin family protein [Hydrogenivirga caldilitoris]